MINHSEMLEYLKSKYDNIISIVYITPIYEEILHVKTKGVISSKNKTGFRVWVVRRSEYKLWLRDSKINDILKK